MGNLIFTDKDKKYRNEIVSWLPKNIIDVHTHTGIPNHYLELSQKRKRSSFAASLSEEWGYQSNEKISSSYRQLFPEINIRFGSFPFPFKEVDVEKANRYIMSSDFPFLLATPTTRGSDLEKLADPTLVGFKVYYDFVDKPYSSIKINDFVNPEVMNILNKYGKTLMLHVPGDSLADKTNMGQVISISDEFPNAKIILAHMGRCQTEGQAKASFGYFKDQENVYFDTSTVSNSKVLEEGLKIIGVKRILYGSDSPLSKIKARIMKTDTCFGVGFITEDVFPWTLPELRKWYLETNPELTFLGYHDLLALKEATDSLNISRKELEDIFSNNAENLFRNKS